MLRLINLLDIFPCYHSSRHMHFHFLFPLPLSQRTETLIFTVVDTVKPESPW